MKSCIILSCQEYAWSGRANKCLEHRFSCLVDGCNNESKDSAGKASGMCSLHRSRKLRNGSTDPIKCGIDGCFDISVNPSSKPRCDEHRGYTKKEGYRVLSINGKYIPEHRHIMEQHLGRKLYGHETVHHINGIRNDNRIENLELWSTYQPSGQRVEDKILWAKEILKIYEKYL